LKNDHRHDLAQGERSAKLALRLQKEGSIKPKARPHDSERKKIAVGER